MYIDNISDNEAATNMKKKKKISNEIYELFIEGKK